ncbi:telomere-binding protein cav-like [Calliphora vicina]|uniref:telomere-binding protein cav-like n=1 Tax=Calliphora vicina TaxID=7373 RepID=UPI00325A8ED0
MGDEISENSLVYNHYLKLSTPTKADFERVFTEDELKKLCLKHKCNVNMYRWNVVNDYRIAFTKSGRYQRWPENVRLGMLAKAVNKMKPSVLYDEQEIIKTRKEEWDFQLNENILSLNYWQRKRQRSTEPHNSPRLVVTDSEDMDEGVEYAVNTETINVEKFLTQTQSHQTPTEDLHFNGELDQEVQLQIDVNTENVPANAILTQVLSPQSDDGENLLSQIDDEELLIYEDSEDSVMTVLCNESQLQSEEVISDIDDVYRVNTMSIRYVLQITFYKSGLKSHKRCSEHIIL